MASSLESNPHTDQQALDHSCYARWSDDRLVVGDGSDAPPLASRVHAALRAVILDPEFPCVGARSAMNQGGYRFGMYPELATEDGTAGLAHDLAAFIAEQEGLGIEGQYHTFIAAFDAPKTITPEEFETLLWEQLRLLHDLDREPWDERVERDPADPRFSFSFGGRAFFVVGLSPMSPRWARRFPWPTLAFNPHEQFEELRASGPFDRIQEVIRERDRHLEGDINPNLSNFGEHPEARQYSGREVGDDWRCPVDFGSDAR